MRRFGLAMARTCWFRPARRVWERSPEDMVKCMILTLVLKFVAGFIVGAMKANAQNSVANEAEEVLRRSVRFDTSRIPHDETITGATLSVAPEGYHD